jgi:hypothetical protein
MADLLASRLGVTPPKLIRIDGYLIDLATSETYTFPGEVTKFPAEVGPDTSDHIRDLSPEIEIECIVSDLPSADVASDSSRQVDDVTGEAPLPSEDALAFLLDMKARRRPVVVEASLGTFPSMACEEIEVTRDKDKNNALFFKAKFKKFVQIQNTRQRVRVRTQMPAGKPLPKNAVSNVVRVDDNRIVWRHGNPPGAAIKPGDLSSIVFAEYNFGKGLTPEERVAFGRDIIGNQQVRYFDLATGDEITGDRRRALIQDLVRDAQASRHPDTRSAGAPTGVNTKKLELPPIQEVLNNGPLLGP